MECTILLYVSLSIFCRHTYRGYNHDNGFVYTLSLVTALEKTISYATKLMLYVDFCKHYRPILKLSMICGVNFSLLRHGTHLLGDSHIQEGVLSLAATPCSSPSHEGSFLHFFGTRFNPMANTSRSPLLSICKRRKFFQCSIRRLEKPASY